jgi:hypothetical protein
MRRFAMVGAVLAVGTPCIVPGLPNAAQESESNSGYLAGRNATWIWMATPGALKPRMSLLV